MCYYVSGLSTQGVNGDSTCMKIVCYVILGAHCGSPSGVGNHTDTAPQADRRQPLCLTRNFNLKSRR
jgi:hypothetical protein